jgi:hypothetical protein
MLYACPVTSWSHQRLELMEKERVKRMRGGAVNDDDEDVPGVSGPKGGFAARRAKAQAAAQGWLGGILWKRTFFWG